MILFLDFDGVLHSAIGNNDLWCRSKALARVLRKYPDVKVVITSSWREHRDLEELKRPLGKEIAERVIGVTPVLSPLLSPQVGGSRQAEVEAWIAENPVSAYLALDDMPELFQKDCPWLITTDGQYGLDSASIHTLRKRLDDIYQREEE